MASGKGNLERIRRGLRTVFFMLTMVASLLILSLPILGAAGDMLVSFALISSFTCFSCYGFRDQMQRYSFKSSLIDIPLVSVFRSLVITCKIDRLEISRYQRVQASLPKHSFLSISAWKSLFLSSVPTISSIDGERSFGILVSRTCRGLQRLLALFSHLTRSLSRELLTMVLPFESVETQRKLAKMRVLLSFNHHLLCCFPNSAILDG